MRPDPARRLWLLMSATGLGLAAASRARATPLAKPRENKPALVPNGPDDQTAALQAAIDGAAACGAPLMLPAGIFRTGGLVLRPGTIMTGSGRLTILSMIGTGPVLSAKGADRIGLSSIVVDGGDRVAPAADAAALIEIDGCGDLDLKDVVLRNGTRSGLSVTASTGRIASCTITRIADAAVFALDSTLTIADNTIADCGNNGILVWRTVAAEDGSRVTGNRVSRIRADGGGSGQNGNGINVFRAGSVQVSGNRITDCAYSAVRGNSASDIAITANSCAQAGEVAIYAEFAFTGALIANNVIDGAGTGIAVTNFNQGGRLAVVQGNVIRNLVRREHEPVDKRGEGISVEADTVVTGNVIEGAPTAGIVLGFGPHMRDVVASANIVRGCRSGVLISADPLAGSALVTGNMISGATDGAIRAHQRGAAFGPDLAHEPQTIGRVSIGGNAVSV